MDKIPKIKKSEKESKLGEKKDRRAIEPEKNSEKR